MQVLSNLFLHGTKSCMNPARAASVLSYCDENLARILCSALHNKLTLGTEYVGMILGNGEVD